MLQSRQIILPTAVGGASGGHVMASPSAASAACAGSAQAFAHSSINVRQTAGAVLTQSPTLSKSYRLPSAACCPPSSASTLGSARAAWSVSSSSAAGAVASGPGPVSTSPLLGTRRPSQVQTLTAPPQYLQTPVPTSQGKRQPQSQPQPPQQEQPLAQPQPQLQPPTSASPTQVAGENGHSKEPTFLPERLPKPHDYFPFDLFSGRAADGLLATELQNELRYVRDHCMIPPYPWGQIIYHDFITKNVLPNVAGDLAELGMGQGGTSIFFARLAKKHGRKFLAVDSFEGLPPPDTGKDNPYFLIGDYRSSGGDNYEAFLRYKEAFDVDDTLHVVKAFFRDLEVPAGFENFAFVHLDSDLYDSVYDSLEKMWPLLSPGGCIAVDDFFHHAQGPARAVSDFFRAHAPEEGPPLLFVVPTYAVLIVKGRSACVGWQDDTDGQRVPLMYSPRALDGNFYSFSLTRQCQPFLRAAEASLLRLEEECRSAKQQGASGGGLVRARINAELFLEFLRYPDSAARSGIDILRYLMPLEDMFDITQGNLCGMAGVDRKTIEIGI